MSGYKVMIRNNETGEQVEHLEKMDWDDSHLFQWVDNNYSCDCNRHLFFERAKGRDPDMTERGCGDGKYTALYAELPSGERIELDEVAAC